MKRERETRKGRGEEGKREIGGFLGSGREHAGPESDKSAAPTSFNGKAASCISILHGTNQ